MHNKKKMDTFTKDLIVLGISAGLLAGTWYLGRRSGLRDGFTYGTLDAYEKVLGAFSF